MKELEYKLIEQESFELKDIFDCGQCFRWNEESNRKLYWSSWKKCYKCKKRWK